MAQDQDDKKYAVMIPCPQEDFAQFISGLLGKPQTIGRNYPQAFTVRRKDIENFFYLVEQRVRQQNEASLIQFVVRIEYDDNSSIVLNSFEDFQHYTEIRPLVSTNVTLTWIYLIRFQDRAAPEKQQIDITFDSATYFLYQEDEDARSLARGHISTRISHTARTWGG